MITSVISCCTKKECILIIKRDMNRRDTSKKNALTLWRGFQEIWEKYLVKSRAKVNGICPVSSSSLEVYFIWSRIRHRHQNDKWVKDEKVALSVKNISYLSQIRYTLYTTLTNKKGNTDSIQKRVRSNVVLIVDVCQRMARVIIVILNLNLGWIRE